MKKIQAWEPCFFIFFGLFHLHRIWAIIDREAYASFWLGILEKKGVAYFIIMGVLTILCILGIAKFFQAGNNNYRWRWIYICGGCYLLFDLFAIAIGLDFWHQLLFWMFDTKSPYWNAVWATFILLGVFSFILGITLLIKYKRQK